MIKFNIMSPVRSENEDDLACKPYIFNQQNTGLAVKNARGDVVELADVSVACCNPISTANLSLKGYMWKVSFKETIYNCVCKNLNLSLTTVI